MFNKKSKKDKENKEPMLNGKVLSGVVVSDKMKDTVVVEVLNYSKHPKYHKFLKTRKKYKAHDAGNSLSIGDKVKIVECAPISKDKHFIVKKEEVSVK